jgi:acetyltransferase
VLASYLGHDGVCPALAVSAPGEAPGQGSVPSWSSPEAAALALARAADHAAWRTSDPGEVPELGGVDGAAGRAAVAGLPVDGSWLPASDAAALLRSVGLALWPTERVGSLEQARAAARRLGWPVGLKSADERWRHRTDVGAVRLDVHDEDELAHAWAAIEPFVLPGGPGGGAFVQPMAPGGVSVVVRLLDDPAVGPLVSLRLGGVAADLLADPVTRTAPLTDLEAERLVSAVRGVSLLRGTDVRALEDVLLRVARLAEEVPEVAEVLLDPVLVGRHGVTVLHAGVRLLPPGVDLELGPRRLVDLRR